MSEQEPVVVEEVTNQTPESPEVLGNETEPVETVEELKEKLENAKAENSRKAELIRKQKEELELRVMAQPESQPSPGPGGIDLKNYRDHELKAALKNPADAAYHDVIEEELHTRRIKRIQASEAEQSVRLSTEIERQKRFPETSDPTHPMAIRATELMRLRRLENTPSGRLVAAELAHAEQLQKKALAAGRKIEQNRQADVNANSTGGAIRPAPVITDKTKDEELKKRAESGDATARAEWFKRRGLI